MTRAPARDDPFGTAALRAGVLAAWAGSPTRFREDANAEEDLRLGGYADTWWVELAQNAADAARAAGVPGRVRVGVDGRECGGHGELRVANTGAPLDAAGVAALASLRASAKRDGASVGRFGVGFAAVLALSDAPRVVTAGGGVAFSRAATARAAGALPGPAAELARRAGQLPVLRLVWPTGADEPPVPAGYATEVRLPLRAGVDAAALLAAARAAAPDLLLALPDLVEIAVAGPGSPEPFRVAGWPGGVPATSGVAAGGAGSAATQVVITCFGRPPLRWLAVRGVVEGVDDAAVEQRARRSRAFCWALPLDADGRPAPLADDVLHAPTTTAEVLTLPARLIVDVPLDPDRRHVRPGPALDAVLDAAAGAYLDLVGAVGTGHGAGAECPERDVRAARPTDPRAGGHPADRLALVPAAGFPRSELDGRLRALLLDRLREAVWLPAAGGGEVAPARATVLDPAGTDDLPALLADVVPGLLAAPVRAAALPAALGVRRLGPAELVERLLGVRRAPAWWRAVYAGLVPVVDAGLRDELRALPVPLADGRTVPGPSGVLLPDPATVPPAVPGLPVAHPDAAHPLLSRLGAAPVEPAGLLDHPAVRDAVDRSLDDADAGLGPEPLATAVLGLVAELGPAAAVGRPWLRALALTDVDGDPARADELVLAGGPLRPLLADDAPPAVLAPEWERRAPREALVAVGVLDGFAVVDLGEPDGSDDDRAADLDDVEAWLDGGGPAAHWTGPAVRDLDLVRDDAWPAALALLAARPETRAAVLAPGGYTAWWLARHARLGGRRPGYWRLPSAEHLAALYDPAPAPVDEAVLAAAGVRADLTVAGARDAADLLDRLADPGRHPDAGLAAAAHAALAAAVAAGRVDPADLDPPGRVRALDGTVVDAVAAAVLDVPWLAAVLPPGGLVVGDADLADLLDLPTASEIVEGAVVDAGEPVAWGALPEVVVACAALGVAVPAGELRRHDTLRVALRRTDGGRPHEGRYRVPAWRDAAGAWHAEDPVRALLGRLASDVSPGDVRG